MKTGILRGHYHGYHFRKSLRFRRTRRWARHIRKRGRGPDKRDILARRIYLGMRRKDEISAFMYGLWKITHRNPPAWKSLGWPANPYWILKGFLY